MHASNTDNSTQASTSTTQQPIFGRPLVPYFLSTITSDAPVNTRSKKKKAKIVQNTSPYKKELLTVNLNHDLTEEHKSQQQQLVLPEGETTLRVRRFNKDGYFEYDTMNLSEIEQHLQEKNIQLVPANNKRQKEYEYIESALLDENGQVVGGTGKQASYYDTVAPSGGKKQRKARKSPHKKRKQKKQSKKPIQKVSSTKTGKRRQEKRYDDDSSASYDDTTDDESYASTSGTSSEEDTHNGVQETPIMDLPELLRRGGLLSPLDLLAAAPPKTTPPPAQPHPVQQPQQITTPPVQTQSTPPQQSQFVQPQFDMTNQSQSPPQHFVDAMQRLGMMPPPQFMPQGGMGGPPPMHFAPHNITPPPFAGPPPHHLMGGMFMPHQQDLQQQQQMMAHMHHQMMMQQQQQQPQMMMPPQQQPPQNISPQQQQQEPQTPGSDTPQTEMDILKRLGLTEKKAPQFEKFAGGSWSNSPPPSSLPLPKFSM